MYGLSKNEVSDWAVLDQEDLLSAEALYRTRDWTSLLCISSAHFFSILILLL